MANEPSEPSEVPAAPDTSKTCPNCGAPLDGVYCKSCGQKDVQLRSVRAYVGDAWSDMVGLDSRVVRTLRLLLFYPGRLTTEYWAGRRTHYVTPIRLYLSVTFLAFSLSFFAGRSVEDDDATGDSWIRIGVASPESVSRSELETRSGRVEMRVGDRQSTSSFLSDSAEVDLESIPGGQGDSVDFVAQPGVPVTRAEMESLFAYLDHGDTDGYGAMKERLGLGEEVDEAVTTAWISRLESGESGAFASLLNAWISEVESDPLYGAADSILGRLAIGLMRGMLDVDGIDGIKSVLRHNINVYMPRALFLAMPFMALVLNLVFIRRRRLFVEHLVFSIHAHTTLFVALSMTSVISILSGIQSKWSGVSGSGQWFDDVVLVFFVGLIIAGLKRAYGQSWSRGIATGALVLGLQAVLLLTLVLVSALGPVVQAGWS